MAVRNRKTGGDKPFGSHAPRGWLAVLRRKAIRSAVHRGSKNSISTLLRRHADLFGGVYDVNYRDMKLRIYPSENACDNWIFRSGRHPEEDDLQTLSRFKNTNSTFVDIGANIGIYTLTMAKLLGGKGRIVAFEPHPDTFRKLGFNLSANAVANVSAVSCAIGDQEGTLPLYIPRRQNAGQNSLKPAGSGKGRSVPVEVHRLSAMLDREGISKPDIIKLDVEGAEDAALLTYLDDVPENRWPDYVILEISHQSVWQRDCAAELVKAGYTCVYSNAANSHYARESAS